MSKAAVTRAETVLLSSPPPNTLRISSSKSQTRSYCCCWI